MKIMSDWVQGLSVLRNKMEFKPGLEGRLIYSRQSTYTERSKGTEVRALEEATTPPAKATLSCVAEEKDFRDELGMRERR